MLLTVLAVITFTALAISVLGFRESSNTQLATDALAETQLNYTYLIEEISALKSLLVQLNSDTQRNISQLDGRLSLKINNLLSADIRPVSSMMRQHINTAQQSIDTIKGSLTSHFRSLSTQSRSLSIAVSYTHLTLPTIYSV